MNISEEEIAFHYEISSALAQWVYVEGQLERIVLQCVPLPSREALAAAYASIETFYAKLRFCDNLVTATFRRSAHIEKWRTAYERSTKLVGNRNKIAHGLRGLYVNNTIGRRFAIVDPRPVNGRVPHMKSAKPPSGSLCLLDLAKITVEFHSLTTDLCNVYELLDGRPAPFPEGVERDDGPPTIRSVRNQIRVRLGLPWPPSRKKSSPPENT